MSGERKIGRLDTIMAWPDEVPSLTGGESSFALIDPFSLNRVSLTRTEALIVNAIQLANGESTTVADIVAGCARRFGVTVTDVQVEAVADALERYGFFAGFDFVKRFGHQQWHLAKAHEAITAGALRRLVGYLKREIPYYKETLAAVAPEDELRKMPCITKEQIRRNLPKLLPEDGVKKLGAFWQSTSGTTGDRLQVPHDAGYFERGMGATYALNPVTLHRTLGHPFVILTTPVCSGTECHAQMELPYEKRLWGGMCLYLNSGVNPAGFGDKQFEEMAADMRRLGPRSLNCDTAYAVSFARWVLARQPALPKLDAITACFEVPSAIHKAELVKAFGCPIFEDYSANDVGAIAMECPQGTMHVPSDYMIVEILDREMSPVAPGQVGRVYLTTLRKSAMPLLRYKTTDLAMAASGPCACGSPHPGFKSIEGRTSECILSPDGAPITPRGVDRAVSAVTEGIGWYTLAQVGPKAYRMSVVPHGALDDDRVMTALRGLLGPSADISIARVKELRPAASGKFRLAWQESVVRDVEELF